MTNIKNWIFGAIATSSIMISGCSSNPQNNLQNAEEYTLVDSISNSNVYGFVTDDKGEALAYVVVTTGQDTVITDEDGYYVFDKCRAVNGRSVVKFERPNYFSVVRTADIVDGGARVDALLLPQDSKEGVTEIARFYNSKGATIKVGKMEVAIPANSLVYEKDGKPFNGSVLASVYYLNPNSETFTKEMPGGDMSGVTSSGKSVILLSYGMVEVTLKDSVNQKLQLKEGSESTLTFPVPDGYTEEQKLASIPLWHFDEAKGTWVEDGVATKKGDIYSGNVKHFSWWNLDCAKVRATIKGRVTNQSGEPLPGVLVTISQTSARTDKNGFYYAFVPNNTPVFVTVSPNDYAGYANPPIYNVDGLAAETVYTQDIVLPDMPAVHGTVKYSDGEKARYYSVYTGKTYTSTDKGGNYSIYYNENEPLTVFLKTQMLDVNDEMKYEFRDASEINSEKRYDFVISRPKYICGVVRKSDGSRVSNVPITVLIDGKEYQVKSPYGYYGFYVSSEAKELSAYVKANDGLGVESNKVTENLQIGNIRCCMSPIIIPAGITVSGSILNTCGPSKANVTLTVGRGKNKKTYEENTSFGYFSFDLPLSTFGSEAKIKINCRGKKITKKVDLDKSDIDLGTTEICAGEKPDPNCIYAIVGDQTIRFDTKKDMYTEMYQRTQLKANNFKNTYKYQAWFKNSSYKGTLVLEIDSWCGWNKSGETLSAYLISDNMIAKSKAQYVSSNKDNMYTFTTDYELNNEAGEDNEVYLYGSADIEKKFVETLIDVDYVDKNALFVSSKILGGKSGDSKFLTLTMGKQETQKVEDVLKKKGFKEKSTFLDAEQRFTSIFIQDNAEALIHRNQGSTSDVTFLVRDGIGRDSLYQCWKVDFRGSSLKKRGDSNINYMWKNEADIAQLVMFGPIMGVKFTKTDIKEEKCGCTVGNGPAVAN